jgi:glycogen synthase
LVVAHSCVLSWWEAVKREPLPDQWLTYAAAVSRGLRSADLVVAPSLAMLNALKRIYRRLPPTRVIYNGRGASSYHAGRKNHFVLSAGRMWDDAKNVSALTAIASRLPWPLRIAGEASSDEAKLSNVTALGQLDEKSLAAEMSRAAIYALPARYEPFGLSALEAALSGCALVLGDIESLREIWGNAALFVEPDDHESLLETLVYLIEKRESRLTMANRAAMRARRFAPAQMAREYLDVYQQLLSQKQPTTSVLQATRG